MDNNLEDFDPTGEESCGSAESSPRRSARTSKMKRNEWSDSRIIMPFFPLEAIKEEVTPCSSTQRLENNLSVIKNKLRSGSDTAPAPAHCDQRTKLFIADKETNSVKSNVYDDPVATAVVNGNAVTNFNYNTSLQTRNNLYNIKSKMLKSRANSSDNSAAATSVTARSSTKVNDTHISNIDSSRDTSDNNDETKVTAEKISSELRNIKNIGAPAKPKRKSINSAADRPEFVKTNRNLSAEHRQRTYIVSRNTTPRSMKYNSCVDELKYYNLRNGMSKDPSAENSARKQSSNYEDDLDSGMTTNRTDRTDMNVSLLFEVKSNKENTHESKESDNISSNNSTLKDSAKKMDNTLDMTNISECKDFKYFLMHSNNKTSSASTSVNLTESDQNSPTIQTDNSRVKKQENTYNATNSIKPNSKQESTRIPRIVNKSDKSKNVPRSESKYKMEKCINKLDKDLNDLRSATRKSHTKSEHSSASSSKSKQEPKRKDSNTKEALNKDIYTSSTTTKCTSESLLKKSTQKSQYSTQMASNSKHDIRPTNSSKITRSPIDSNDTEDTARSAIMKNISRHRRYSMGESFTAKSDKIKSTGDHGNTRRTTTYINDKQYDDNQTLEKERKTLQKNSSRNDSDCHSKPSDFSPKSDSLKVECYRNVKGRYHFPSTDGTVDCSEASYNSKVNNRENITDDDIYKMSSQNVYVTERDASPVNGHFEKGDCTYSDFGDFSLATMRLCGECNYYSDLSTQDSFSTNTKDTWTQVHYSDIMKEIRRMQKKQKNKEREEEEEEIYTDFLKRQGDRENERKVRSGNTLRKERYRKGRELNFNYDKPVQNYLINSSRQHTTRRPRDDDTSDCCGCIKFSYFRRIFSR